MLVVDKKNKELVLKGDLMRLGFVLVVDEEKEKPRLNRDFVRLCFVSVS